MSVFQSWGKTDQTAVKGGFVTRVGPWLSKARRLLGVQFLSVVTRDLGVCPEPESSFQLQRWRRKWQSTPVFLPGKSHGQRSLAGYSPWSPKSRTRLSD